MDMAELFNEYFATVFTNEVGSYMPEVLTVCDGNELSDIYSVSQKKGCHPIHGYNFVNS